MEVIIDGVTYVPKKLNDDKYSLYEKALAVRFDCDAGDNITVKDYLEALLRTLWNEQEGFSGKRPFGNSCWEYELYRALVEGGVIEGEISEDGDLEDFNKVDAWDFVDDLILYIFREC